MLHHLHRVLKTSAQKREQTTHDQKETQRTQPPPHIHPRLVHRREYHGRKPSQHLTEEGDESHDLRLLSLRDDGHGKRSLRREHPSEGDSHQGGVEVDQSLPLGAGDRRGDQGVGDGEEDFGHPEGIEGVDLPTH
mmetsp:Transcript_28108/g.59112  ORF Transcript_28108/g.59112 Transcript_28108/m.59112 type:complete len:135 (-) Transcript_28108:1199-1603(-)